MYYIFAAIILLLNAAIFVSHFFKEWRSAKIVRTATYVQGGAGAALFAFSLSFFFIQLKRSGLDENTVSWAKDMFFAYFKLALIFTAVIGALVILSSLIQAKGHLLRSALCFFGGTVILLTAPVYSIFAQSENVNVSGFVLMCALSLSMVFASFAFMDYERNNKVNKGKNKK